LVFALPKRDAARGDLSLGWDFTHGMSWMIRVVLVNEINRQGGAATEGSPYK